MTALTGPRALTQYSTDTIPAKSWGLVATSQTVYPNAFCGRDSSGTLAPMGSSIGLRAEGFAEIPAGVSSQAAGTTLTLQHGCRWLKNSSAPDAITDAHIGRACYAVDDQTVALTQGEGATIRALAGIIVAYDSTLGVAVLVGPTVKAGAAIQKLEQVIEFSDLTAAAVTEAIALGTLPATAYVLSHEIYIETLFSGASASACVLDIGGTDVDAIVDGHDVFTGAATGRLTGSTLGVHSEGYFGSQAMVATFTATGDDVADLTAGKLTITIPYLVF